MEVDAPLGEALVLPCEEALLVRRVRGELLEGARDGAHRGVSEKAPQRAPVVLHGQPLERCCGGDGPRVAGERGAAGRAGSADAARRGTDVTGAGDEESREHGPPVASRRHEAGAEGTTVAATGGVTGSPQVSIAP